MARVVWIDGSPRYVNDGERRVVERLQSVLPDSFVLIPDITVPYPLPNTPEEYDVVVVSPDAVFVVETKDLAGAIEVTEQYLIRNGEQKKNPWLQTRIKPQKLATRLKDRLPWFGQGGWVDHVVVLARTPTSFKLDVSMSNRILLMDQMGEILGPDTPLIKSKHHGQLSTRIDEVVKAITGGATIRERKNVFDRFRATTPLLERDHFAVWEALNTVTGEEVVLEVNSRPGDLKANDVPGWRAMKLHLYQLMREIGSSPDLDGPREVFELENGSIVTVWPAREMSLSMYLSRVQERGESFDPSSARNIVAGFASALHHLHSRGWALGDAADLDVLVRDSGRGAFKIGGQAPRRNGDKAADLRQLGRLIDSIRALADDEVLSDVAASLRVSNDAELPSTAFVLSSLENLPAKRESRYATARETLGRFEIRATLATHSYGKTVDAFDKTLSQRVLLKYESSRPGGDWVLREYRALNHPSALASSNVAKALVGDTADGMSYVATEYVDAPTLATAIDAGVFARPTEVRGVVLRILEVVRALHPDVEAVVRLLDEARGVMSDDHEVRLGELRDGGLAHNLLDPSNIFLDEGKGVVLVDFTRAGRFGESIPERNAHFWPADLPLDVSDPRADLYAIGCILTAMLERVVGDLSPEEKIELRNLRDVAMKATSPDAQDRFLSADQFVDALGRLAVGVLPEPPLDVWQLQQKINGYIAALEFDAALALCPENWAETRSAILRKRALVATSGTLVLEIDRVTLSHVGRVEIPGGMTAKNDAHEGGEAEVYIVSEPSGGHFEVHVASALVGGRTEQWIAVSQAVAEPPQMGHVARSLRMSVNEIDGGKKWIELRQARLKKNAKFENQASRIRATESMLQEALGSESVRSIFDRFGATAFGTKENVIADKGKSRYYLAVVYEDAPHIPAIAHFVTRIMPLYRGLEVESG